MKKDISHLKILIVIAILFSIIILVSNFLPSISMITDESILSLKDYNFNDDKIINLNGNWEYYPKQLLSYSQLNAKTNYEKNIINLPGNWNNRKFTDNSTDVFGYGTYHLKIIENDNKNLKILLSQMFDSYKIFIDDELIIENAEVSTFDNNSVSSIKLNSNKFSVNKKEFDIIIQVSNNFNGKLGRKNNIYIGSEKKINRYINTFSSIHILINLILAIILFLIFILFVFSRKKIYFFILMFNLIILIRNLFLGNLFLPQTSLHFTYDAYIYINCLTAFFLFLFYQSTYYVLLNKYFDKRIYMVLSFIIVFLISIFLISPEYLLTRKYLIPIYLMVILIPTFMYYVIFNAIKDNNEYGKIFLISNLFFHFSAIHDFLEINTKFHIINMQLLPISMIIISVIFLFLIFKNILKNQINNKQSEKLFALLDNMPLGVIEVDSLGNLLFINTDLRKELNLIDIKLKDLKITNFINMEFWEFLLSQIATREIVSDYQKKIGDKIYQLTLKKKIEEDVETYLILFNDRTKEIDYGLKLEKIMNSLEETIEKRTNSIHVFKDMITRMSKIEIFNFNDENEFLIEIFHIGLNLVNKINAGSIYVFEKNKVRFVDTLGHNLKKLNDTNISVLDFEFPTSTVRFVDNITQVTENKFNQINNICEKENYKKGIVNVKETIIIGLSFNNKITGGIAYEIRLDSEEKFNHQDKEFFNVLSNVYNSYYKNFKYQKQREIEMNNTQLHLKNKLRIDDLTGINNKKYFNELFQKYWELSLKENTNISIIMMDIDNFKNYNDTYGHIRGDFVLKEVAKSLKLRDEDMVARYGGEEFIALFYNMEHEMVVSIAERIRENVELLNIENFISEKRKKLTISLGVATTIATDDIDKIKLIEKADENLYRAKNDGRNKVGHSKL
jgi:diguanylate cyclase (GGDEF)-like protein